MKRKQCTYSLWIAVVVVALAILTACGSSKPLKKAPDKTKPAANDSSDKKIDTGPSEFFDGAGIHVKYPDAGMQKLNASGMICAVHMLSGRN